MSDRFIGPGQVTLPFSEAPPGASIGSVLLVDDEAELRTLLVSALTTRGYEAVGCASGAQALAELEAKNFDILLTDLMMSEMDGIELISAALFIDPHLVGIIMTGQGTIQTAVDAMQQGAFDYILKPFQLESLMPVLTRAINERRLRLENLELRETLAIYELSQTIAFTPDVQTVLSKLADAALEQSDADEVSILLPTVDGTELYVAAVRGAKRERLLGERIPFAESIASWVARERTGVILNGAVQDDRFVALWPRADIRSSISVPMQVAKKLVGVMSLNVTGLKRGAESLSQVHRDCPDTVVVMISGGQTIESAIAAIRGGAFDYLMKPLELSHIEAAVDRAYRHHVLLREKRNYENNLEELVRERTAQIEHLAYHDALTDLPNRALFLDRLSQALNAASRQPHLVGVMLLSLDRFKKIDDTLGHLMGDLAWV